jgi:hypothetical protein
MAISELERARIKHHLRFAGIHTISGWVDGAPLAIEKLYPIDGNISNLTAEGETIVRDQLSRCDHAEKAMESIACHSAVTQVGNIKMNPREFDDKKRFYTYQCKRLADTLSADLNPDAASVSGRNVPRCMS